MVRMHYSLNVMVATALQQLPFDYANLEELELSPDEDVLEQKFERFVSLLVGLTRMGSDALCWNFHLQAWKV